MEPDTSRYSVWKFEPIENGLYKIVNKGSGRVLQMVENSQSAYLHDGLSVVQDVYDGSSSQQFIIKQNIDNTFKLIPLSSLKYLGIPDALQFTSNTVPVQRILSTSPSTDWELVPREEIFSSIKEQNNATLKVFPRIAKSEINIETQHDAFHLKIFDLNSRTIIEKQMKNGLLDISGLNKGIYILQIATGKHNEKVKIFKI